MSEYASFDASFWTGETGRLLHGYPQAQVLAAYLFTSRHKNMIGLYFLPLQYAAHETGLSLAQVSAAFDKLSAPDVRFAYYDTKLEHVWVVSMAKRQISRSPKARLGAVRLVQNSQRGPLLTAFISRYGASLERLQTPSESYGTDTLSELRIPHPALVPAQDQYQEQNQEQGESAADAAAVGAGGDASSSSPKRRKPDEAKAALQAALLASFRATNDVAPEVPGSVAVRAAKRLREIVDLGHAADLPAAATLLVAACRRSQTSRWPWCLTEVSPTRPGVAPPGARPRMSPATTHEDFADADPVEVQLERLRLLK